MKLNNKAAFSLVEVTIALGIAAFALIAVLGLLPVGLNAAQKASEQTVAAQLANEIGEDLLAIGDLDKTPRYNIEPPRGTTARGELFFLKAVDTPPLESGDDEETATSPNIGYTRLATSGGARYAVEVTWRQSSLNESLIIGSITVWWPAAATKDKSLGKVAAAVAVNNF